MFKTQEPLDPQRGFAPGTHGPAGGPFIAGLQGLNPPPSTAANTLLDLALDVHYYDQELRYRVHTFNFKNIIRKKSMRNNTH